MRLEEINKIGVVGAGVMGYGIAINFALWGYPVTVHDLNDDILRQSSKNVRSALSLFVEEGLISEKQATETESRISFCTEIDHLAGASDFITECIVEISEEKRKLFNKLDELCPARTILASNTSSLVLSDFASEVKRQDKIVITHYFAPPHIVPGLEIAKGPQTSQATFNLTYELLKKIHKVPVRVLREQSGYLLNSIQSAMSREAMRLWAEGFASAEDIERGITASFGFRMFYEGPMLHYDIAGIWRWPVEARTTVSGANKRHFAAYTEEALAKLRERSMEGTPWFIDPDKYDEEVEKRDRAYLRRLKELYWPK